MRKVALVTWRVDYAAAIQKIAAFLPTTNVIALTIMVNEMLFVGRGEISGAGRRRLYFYSVTVTL